MASEVTLLGVDRVSLGSALIPPSARVALLSNAAARTSAGAWTGDVVRERCHLTLLLSPEHGIGADATAGAAVPHSVHHGLLVLSLYGADWGPVEAELQNVDAVLIDLPDVGVRYFTYAWTVRELLKKMSALQKPVYLLDRPNPLGGIRIEGNLPDEGMDSAVCASVIPVRHGLTLGELTAWQIRWLGLPIDLHVVRVQNWSRATHWPNVRDAWVPPSPGLRSMNAVHLYPGTCLLEGTNVSEGRGTNSPFEVVGAPFLDGPRLANRLSELAAFRGTRITPVSFVPTSNKWVGELCHGVSIRVTDPDVFPPVEAGMFLVATAAETAKFQFSSRQFDALAGTSKWRQAVEEGRDMQEITVGWKADELAFTRARKSILLYE